MTQAPKENTALSTMKVIRAFCGSIGLPSSEVSVLRMIRYDGMPARQLGKIWESDKELIMDWRKKRLAGDLPMPPPPTPDTDHTEPLRRIWQSKRKENKKCKSKT